MVVNLAVAGDVLDGDYFVLSLSHAVSWMRPGTELSQVLPIFLTCVFAIANQMLKWMP